MASMAERRCVGVYSRSFEMRSMALGSAFRNTYASQPVFGDPLQRVLHTLLNG